MYNIHPQIHINTSPYSIIIALSILNFNLFIHNYP